MAKFTLQQKLEAALKARGFRLEASRGSRIPAWCKGPHRFYVGEAGGLRSGQSYSESHSIGCPQKPNPCYLALLDEGEKILTAQSPEARMEAALAQI